MKKADGLLYTVGAAILYGGYRLLKAVATKVLAVMEHEANRPCQYGNHRAKHQCVRGAQAPSGERFSEFANMTISYETIRPEVERLRYYLTNDLDRLIAQDVGGNYLAAVLITCACDALSYLKHGQRNRGDLFFTELLPDLWKPVAKTLYNAIRNGIVHTYETKTIILGSRRLSVGISWNAKPHLHLSETGTHIYVNIRQLSQDLKTAVAQFEADLKADAKLRKQFHESMQGEREIPLDGSEKQKWQDMLSHVPHEVV